MLLSGIPILDLNKLFFCIGNQRLHLLLYLIHLLHFRSRIFINSILDFPYQIVFVNTCMLPLKNLLLQEYPLV